MRTLKQEQETRKLADKLAKKSDRLTQKAKKLKGVKKALALLDSYIARKEAEGLWSGRIGQTAGDRLNGLYKARRIVAKCK